MILAEATKQGLSLSDARIVLRQPLPLPAARKWPRTGGIGSSADKITLDIAEKSAIMQGTSGSCSVCRSGSTSNDKGSKHFRGRYPGGGSGLILLLLYHNRDLEVLKLQDALEGFQRNSQHEAPPPSVEIPVSNRRRSLPLYVTTTGDSCQGRSNRFARPSHKISIYWLLPMCYNVNGDESGGA